MAAQPTAWAWFAGAGRRAYGRAMERVDLGPLRVSRLCLGTMLMGGRTPADEAPRACSTPTWRPGHNFLDTADVYGDGDLRAHARALAGAPARRGRGGHQGALRGLRPRRRRASRPSASCAACDASLRRLGDRRHRPLPGPRARPRRRAGGHAGGARRPRARRQGARARRLELPRLAAGLGGRRCRIARASPPSSRCSRSTRSSSARSRPRSCPSAAPPGSACCRGARSGPASSPAATSATTQPPPGTRIGDAERRPRGGDRTAAAPRRNFRAVDEARAVADELGASVAQVAIAWLLAQPGVTAPIIGPRTLEQLEDLLPAAELTLTAEQVERLGRWTAPARGYPERMNIEQNGDRRRHHPAAALSRRVQLAARACKKSCKEQGFCLVASTPVAPSRLPARVGDRGNRCGRVEASAGANRRMAAA